MPGTRPQTECTYRSRIRTLLLPFYQPDFHVRESICLEKTAARRGLRAGWHGAPSLRSVFVEPYSSDHEINLAYPCVKWRPDPEPIARPASKQRAEYFFHRFTTTAVIY